MQVKLRRGLPRVPGGEPWPPAGTVNVADALVEAAPIEAAPTPVSADTVEVPLRRGLPRVPGGEPWPPAGTVKVAAPAVPAAETATVDDAEPAHTVEVPLRQGMPRVEGGEPWPPAGTVRVAAPAPGAEPEPQPAREPAQQPTPLPARVETAGKPEGVARQWLPWAIGALLLLAAAVFGARWYVGTEAGADFIARYNGIQPLPDNAPTGLPGWLNWAHFFNMFLMALIIKTGIDVRREKRPAAYWQPKKGGKKISVTLWLHQALDIAWVVLGVVFFVLLFTTGQWMRIVPTSWEVIPHAVSAGLQYLSLDWPTENPWLHYNALQELSYFVTVFIASPLAIASGFRMSGMWPASWKAVPMSWARAVHFPTMIYFVAFVVVHVFLVLTTGVRGNMNAMFAAREDATSWIGVVLFLVAAGVTALGWFFARASVVAPVAGRTGKVSKR